MFSVAPFCAINRRMRKYALALLLIFPAPAKSTTWSITLEEPTGIYRRDDEVVTVKLHLPAGEAWKGRLQLLDAQGSPLRHQIEVTGTHPDGSIETADLMFPITVIPGERPVLRLSTVSGAGAAEAGDNSLTARTIGTGRLEMANDRFGVLLNLGRENTEPAITSLFNRTAGAQRMLNLVDTSPGLKTTPPFGRGAAGFGTFLEGAARSGAFDNVEILERGPFRARVLLTGARLGGTAEAWEFTWNAGSPVLLWKTRLPEGTNGRHGFFCSSVSASPYVPFDRWIDGAEDRFPDGWEIDNPPDRKIAGMNLADLPGGHVLYYQRQENYGGLGIFEIDRALEWKGIGAAQFAAVKAGPAAAIALAFPRWKGTETVLEARADYRRFMQPVLSVVQPAPAAASPKPGAEASAPVAAVRPVDEIARETDGAILDLGLREAWRLNWAEKSEGEKRGYHRSSFDDRRWRSVEVPGSAHVQVLTYPKYFSREAEWVSDKEWWYRNLFRIPASARGKRLRLRFDATDYYADVWLNDRLLGRHEGYIDPYEFEVSGLLREDGDNLLAVRVWTPVSYYWRHRPYTVKGAYGAVDQKPDNITAVGLTRPVHVLAGGPVVIRDVAVDTRLNPDLSADVIVDLELDGVQSTSAAEVALGLSPRNFNEPEGVLLRTRLDPAPGGKRRKFLLHVAKPRLWWTWDHGDPSLYTLVVTVRCNGAISDRTSLAVGIREIEHIDWKFYLNGRRMFVRGTNSYYHLFLSEVQKAAYERDLRLMKSMNVNMVRLHCHFSNPEFYELADELGILVWQDYLEAWYPEDPAFAVKAAALYDPLIRTVRNHPSVALWAASDEESTENYRVLTKHLEPRIYALDPQRRPVVRSTGRYGDSHVYYGWYEGSIWEYTGMSEKFVSELGATALPNYETLIRFLPNAWPIREHAQDWVFHKLQIPEAMRAWGDPGTMSMQEYIPQTQDYVARLFQLAIERMRRLKYNPAGGILHFHAIDIWPSVTMAALDYWRQPTKAYYTVQRSFQPFVPSFAYDRDTWKSGEAVRAELWVINDEWRVHSDVTMTWRLEDGAGKVVERADPARLIEVAADSSAKLQDVRLKPLQPGKYVLWASIADSSGKVISENNYEFKVK